MTPPVPDEVLRPRIGPSLDNPKTRLTPTKLWYKYSPTARFAVVGALFVLALIVSTWRAGDLSTYSNTPLDIALHGKKKPQDVPIPLVLDGGGLVFIFNALLKPILCAKQVAVIEAYSKSNKDNSFWRTDLNGAQVLPAEITTANKLFSKVQKPLVSVIIAKICGGTAVVLYIAVGSFGPLAAWNPSQLSQKSWTKKTYDGWWANFDKDPAAAVLLCIIGTYYLYFLTKQLWMGFVFAKYATAASWTDEGVIPNYAYNSDGYWGLLSLRRFMQWTYVSTVADFAAALAMFLWWLPFSQYTIVLGGFVLVLNVFTVTYPTALAFNSAEKSKQLYVKSIVDASPSGNLDDRSQTHIAQVWSSPSLPFRARSSVVAVGIYLLAPLSLAILSSLALPK